MTTPDQPVSSAQRQPRSSGVRELAQGLASLGRRGVPLERLLLPYVVCLLGAGLSFGAWVVPWPATIRRGFELQADLTIGGLGLLLAWYLLAAAAAVLGWRVGRRAGPVETIDRAEDGSVYRWLAWTAVVGVVGSYAIVAVPNPSLLVEAVVERRFNLIRDALPYAAGLQTLRYASILAGGIAFSRVWLLRRIAPVDVVSILMLMLSAAIASRLSVVLAILIGFGIVAYKRPGTRVTLVGAVAVAIAFFLVTTPLSYLRTGNYYRQNFNTGNPFLINAGEFVAYLSAPFQASMAVANHMLDGGGRELVSYVEPAFPNSSFERGKASWIVVSTRASSVPRVRDAQPGIPGLFHPAVDGPGNGGLVFDLRAEPTAIRVVSARLMSGGDVGGAAVRARLRYEGQGDVRALVGIAPGLDVLGSAAGSGWTWPARERGRVLSPDWIEISGRVPAGVAVDELYRVGLYVFAPSTARGRLFVDELVVGHRAERDLGKSTLLHVMPTYFPFRPEVSETTSTSYRNVVEIEEALATNSAFARLLSAMGHWAFALLAGVAFAAAVVAGHASRYRSYAILAWIVVAYCFAELWRTYLFTAGIIHFLVLGLVAVCLLSVVTPALRRRRPG